MKRSLQNRGMLYIQRSQEEVDRTTMKDDLAREAGEEFRSAITVNYFEPSITQPFKQDKSATNLPRYPSTFPSTPLKCSASDASIGPHSTETTPKKLIKSEAVTQNTLVEDIFHALFSCVWMDIKWPRDRNMS